MQHSGNLYCVELKITEKESNGSMKTFMGSVTRVLHYFDNFSDFTPMINCHNWLKIIPNT